VGVIHAALDGLAAGAVVLLAVAWIVRRSARLFRRRGGGCGCASEGTAGCPAATAARDVRAAARRAAARGPAGTVRTPR
jgi:hypothetical protein